MKKNMMKFTSTIMLVLMLILLAFIEYSSARNKSEIIHFGAFVPEMKFYDKNNKLAEDKFGYKNAIEMAVEHINNRTDILPNHTIQIHFGETYGQAPIALDTFIRFITSGPKKIGLLGPAYSAATYPVAELATINSIIQVTYASLLPKLVNRFLYPFFFRSTPSILAFNDAKLAWMRHFKWNRVGIIYDYSRNIYFEGVDRLQKSLKSNGFDVVAIEGFSSDFGGTAKDEMNRLKKLDARIIVAEVSKWGAQTVFCEAYKHGMYGDNYVWMVSFALYDDWYMTMKPYNYCRPEELRTAIEGYFYTTRLDLRIDGKKTASGMTAPEFFSALKKRAPSAQTYASYAFDAVWLLAESYSKISKTNNLSDYTYKDYAGNYKYSKVVSKTKFEGISGPLRFDKERERMGYVRIGQFRNGTKYDVALHYSKDANITFYPGQREKLFNGKQPPLDHTVVEYIAKELPTAVIAVMWSLAVFGLAAACFFLYFNIRYRENRLIKMSSPMINNVIIIGSILCYVSVILFGLDTRVIAKKIIPRMCNVFVWVLSFGFTLSFGALFSKTWRVYKIFTAAKSMERVAILDRHLFGIIIVLLGVDVILLTLWMTLSPYSLKALEVSRVENIFRDVIEVTQLYQCSANYGIYFSSTALAYKGILLLFGLFLAWETRYVEVPALNDSKFIGMAVYNVAAISAIGVTCTYALSNSSSSQASYTIVCLCIILCNTVTLCLVFLPKLTLLFSKNADMATENSRISMSKHRAVSTLSGTGKFASRELLSDDRSSTCGFPAPKKSVTTMSSFASTAGLDTFDATAWSASMNELSSSYKNEDSLQPSRKTSSTLPPNMRKQSDSSSKLSFCNKLFGRSSSCRASPSESPVWQVPERRISAPSLNVIPCDTTEEKLSRRSVTIEEKEELDPSELPNGVSSPQGIVNHAAELKDGFSPRILPSIVPNSGMLFFSNTDEMLGADDADNRADNSDNNDSSADSDDDKKARHMNGFCHVSSTELSSTANLTISMA